MQTLELEFSIISWMDVLLFNVIDTYLQCCNFTITVTIFLITQKSTMVIMFYYINYILY